MVGTQVRVASPQEEEVWEQCCGPGSLRQVTPGALLTRPLPASSADSSASSLIITLTTEPLLTMRLQETKSEVSPVHHYQLCAPCIGVFLFQPFFPSLAAKAWDMGAKVYCLGVKDCKKYQVIQNS